MLLFSHPTGNANVRHAALGLHRAGLLSEFWTCINYRAPRLLQKMLPQQLDKELKRRSFPTELQSLIRTQPWREATRLFAGRAGLKPLVKHETGPCSIDAIYHALDRQVSRQLKHRRFRGVYAYEDGALHSFRAAKTLGRLAIYDLPIGYWRTAKKLLTEEAERQPDWASTLLGNTDSEVKVARKDAELQHADLVLVASSFTMKTLEDAPAFKAPVACIPYGAPRPSPELQRLEKPISNRLRVLFVGSLGQRKGLSYLFEALTLLGPRIQATFVGQKPSEPCPALERALAKHRWIASCPHQEILRLMGQHDVFVFPSLFEGFGLVLLEALAMGLPLIATENTAAPDLIQEGQQGFLVPIRSSQAIAEKLEHLLLHPKLLSDLSVSARLRAKHFEWVDYETRLSACLAKALGVSLAQT